MTKYVVVCVDNRTGEREDEEDGVFDNEAEAEEYAIECSSAFSAGYDTMSLMGDEDPIDPDDVDWVVEERQNSILDKSLYMVLLLKFSQYSSPPPPCAISSR